MNRNREISCDGNGEREDQSDQDWLSSGLSPEGFVCLSGSSLQSVTQRCHSELTGESGRGNRLQNEDIELNKFLADLRPSQFIEATIVSAIINITQDEHTSGF
jgi:hypothetical protein